MQFRVLNMGLLFNFQTSIPHLHPKKKNKYTSVQPPFSSKPTEIILNTPKVPNFASSLCLNPSPQIRLFSSSSSSSTQPNDTDSSTSIVFVKGLPLSTSEGRLKMTFASYGEVSRVKIISDKKTAEPFGIAYIWFSSPESAQTAVREMNGEFFDGRFISVMIARPGSCLPRARPRPFKI